MHKDLLYIETFTRIKMDLITSNGIICKENISSESNLKNLYLKLSVF